VARVIENVEILNKLEIVVYFGAIDKELNVGLVFNADFLAHELLQFLYFHSFANLYSELFLLDNCYWGLTS
jgi:hypothetical protein